MGSNPYRRGPGTKHKDSSSLSAKAVKLFLCRINKPGIRNCNMCNKPFSSEGAHNRVCKKCKGKPENKYMETFYKIGCLKLVDNWPPVLAVTTESRDI